MRHSMGILFFAAALSASAAGCTWVHMAPGASSVRVVDGSSAPAGCEKRGEIVVSVKNNVAFYHRNQLRVREELETLARNEAPGLQADTIQPICGAGRATAAATSAVGGAAQTYPLGR